MEERNRLLIERAHQFAHMLPRAAHQHHKVNQAPLVHPGQGKLLLLILSKEPVSQKDLVELLDIRPSSLSELLRKLEAKGLVQRTPDEQDKRNMIVSLTEEGRVIARQLSEHHNQMEDGLFSALSTEEREQLCGLLTKLVTGWMDELGGEDPVPPPPPHHPHGPHHGPGCDPLGGDPMPPPPHHPHGPHHGPGCGSQGLHGEDPCAHVGHCAPHKPHHHDRPELHKSHEHPESHGPEHPPHGDLKPDAPEHDGPAPQDAPAVNPPPAEMGSAPEESKA